MTDGTAPLGSRKLVSIQLTATDSGEIIDVYGPDPLGFLLIHPCGRMMVVITPSGQHELFPGQWREGMMLMAQRINHSAAENEPPRACAPRSGVGRVASHPEADVIAGGPETDCAGAAVLRC